MPFVGNMPLSAVLNAAIREGLIPATI